MRRIGWAKIAGALLLFVLIFLSAFIRPVKVTTERGSSTLLLWAWQNGRIDFINSVTGHPVAMRFALPWRFSGFSAQTDAGTEEYYTMGLYRWNDQLAKESTRNINYCSEVGVAITFGKQIIRTKGGCIRATLLWPPS
ncbi:MAG: hypothetical protein M0P74_11035 [Syntrophales bacterium]|jgi:hypothetical protein|nr:hypothetical protein [Syntrophales bacterium]